MNPGTFGGELPSPLADMLEPHGWALAEHGFMFDPTTGRVWSDLRTTRPDHTPEDILLNLLQLGGFRCRVSDILGIIVYLQ